MPIPVHVICGKCGSTNIHLKIKSPCLESCGVSFSCNNCSTLTSVEKLNEWKEESYPEMKKEHLKALKRNYIEYDAGDEEIARVQNLIDTIEPK